MSDEEKSEVSTNCRQLKLKAPDGKMRITDVADMQGIFRIIQSIPSPKAEPFKMWLAQVGKERIDEIIDPELAIDRALQTYLGKGYTREWINQRLQAIQVRKELTDAWQDHGVKEGVEYAILTNEISKAWSGNKEIAQKGGSVAGNARKEIEQETGRKVITPKNAIDFSKLIGEVNKNTQ